MMSLVKRDNEEEGGARALVKRAQSSYLPQKRPAVVLEEDEYIERLSKVIRRQFFPDLEQLEEAEGGIAKVPERGDSQYVRDNDATPRTRPDKARAHTPDSYDSSRQEPGSLHRRPDRSAKRKSETLSLEAFQSKYTSEDNAGFLEILDKQNLKNRAKYAWHYNNNKIYSENTERQESRLQLERAGRRTQVGWIDDRKAIEGWRVEPKNSLMFEPDGETGLVSSEDHGVRRTTIKYGATRMPEILASEEDASVVDSGTTAVGDVGEYDDFEEPMVNGYTFVDEPDTPLVEPPRNPFPESSREEAIDMKPNPFKIADTPARDQILDRLVTKNRRSNTPTPRAPHHSGALTHTKTPKFKSSPVLSPAAQRMLGSRISGLRDRLKTPAKSKLR